MPNVQNPTIQIMRGIAYITGGLATNYIVHNTSDAYKNWNIGMSPLLAFGVYELAIGLRDYFRQNNNIELNDANQLGQQNRQGQEPRDNGCTIS
jgi:hypothetical protein